MLKDKFGSPLMTIPSHVNANAPTIPKGTTKRTETGIDPFALKKSLSSLHKIFLKNPLEKKINMYWELNETTLEEIKQLDLTKDLIEMMEG